MPILIFAPGFFVIFTHLVQTTLKASVPKRAFWTYFLVMFIMEYCGLFPNYKLNQTALYQGTYWDTRNIFAVVKKAFFHYRAPSAHMIQPNDCIFIINHHSSSFFHISVFTFIRRSVGVEVHKSANINLDHHTYRRQ